MTSQQAYPPPPAYSDIYQPQRQNPYPLQPSSVQPASYGNQPPVYVPQEPPPPYGQNLYPTPVPRYHASQPSLHDPAACHAAQVERAAHRMDGRKQERRMTLGMTMAGVPHVQLIGLGMRIMGRMTGENHEGEHANCGESRAERRQARREAKAVRREARRDRRASFH